MPYASLKLIPGVDQNRTQALNEAAISSCDLIRFVPDRAGIALPQKLGGWTKYLQEPVGAAVSALHPWSDTSSQPYLGIGTIDALKTLKDGNLIDRSPQYYSASPTLDFSATLGSNEVFITDPGSNVSNYDSIFLSTHVAIGGLVLFGMYQCSSFGEDTFSVFETNIIGQPVNATGTSTSGAVALFDTTSGSQTITVTLANHGLEVGSTFPVLVPVSVGGLELFGNYIVKAVNPGTPSNSFEITAQNAAKATESASINGGRPLITYYIGQISPPPSVGYGEGFYGEGGYGTGVTASGGRSFATTNATWSAGVATISFSGRYTIPVGSTVKIEGITPSDYNQGSAVVTAATTGATSTISFLLPSGSAIGPQTVAGTMTLLELAIPAVADWSLDNWGEYLISSPQDGPIFYWSPSEGGQYATLVPNCPNINEGCFVAMPQRQIIAYGSTFNGIKDPMLVRWCDIGNFTSWIGTVRNQAGSFRIPKGSKIVGGMQGPQQALLWTDLAVWSMQYISQPLVWSFNEVASGCGLIGQKAAASLAGNVYWMGRSQFFVLGGQGVQPIPCPIWDVIFQDIDNENLDKVVCATNSRFNEVAWYYPVIGGGGTPSRYVKFNTAIGQWDFGELNRSAWVDQSVLGAPIGATSSGVIYQHETSENADDEAMVSYLETGYFALEDGNAKTFVDQVWPDMKWGYYGGNQNAQVKITFSFCDYPGETPRQQEFVVTKQTQYITPRIRGRLVSIRIESSDKDSFWRLGNIRYRLQPDGRF